MLLVKYLATCVANALVGSFTYTHVGTPRLSAPPRPARPHRERVAEVPGRIGLVVRRVRQDRQRVVERVVGERGHPRAEVGGLHHTRDRRRSRP